MRLLDSDIMIDVFRQFQPAILWIDSLNEELAISGFTALELIQGCQNKVEQQKIERRLADFQVIWLSQTGCQVAYEHFTHCIWAIKSVCSIA